MNRTQVIFTSACLKILSSFNQNMSNQAPIHGDEHINECVICFCQVSMEDQALTKPCNHIYHKECSKEWFKRSLNKCSYCTNEVSKLETNEPINECVICFDEINYKDLAKADPCNHVYHKDCLMKWILIGHTNCTY